MHPASRHAVRTSRFGRLTVTAEHAALECKPGSCVSFMIWKAPGASSGSDAVHRVKPRGLDVHHRKDP